MSQRHDVNSMSSSNVFIPGLAVLGSMEVKIPPIEPFEQVLKKLHKWQGVLHFDLWCL